jgi:RNA polymerase sigma factor (sigma-70 family)
VSAGGGLEVEGLLRELAPRVLGALVRRHGGFDECEDAVQEALLAAALQWPVEGMPESPSGWLITVASRRLVDQARSESARRRREEEAAAGWAAGRADGTGPDGSASHGGAERAPDHDDTLRLLFLCCHPDLSPPSQLALTLRAVGGLSTAEIASAFLVPEATMAQRISRAKQRVKDKTFSVDIERLDVVLHVLYLIFNEGYTASSGPELARVELTREAIRLTRLVHRLLPDDPEVAGLLALMLLTDSRRAARSGPAGLIPLAEQDRSRWDATSIREGVALVEATLPRGPVGPYQLQAAIAAIHAEAPRDEDTDWPQIVALYDLLDRLAPNPMVTLNRAVAVGMVSGPKAGLAALEGLDSQIPGHHRLDAVRAHLHEQAGDRSAALAAYRNAARATTSLPERRYLETRAANLKGPDPFT